MKIYKITSPNTDLVYVGKTIRTLKRRFSDHHSHAKRYMKCGDNYCSSFKVLECGDAVIELIEETDDKSREAHWIKELNTCNQMKLMIDWSDPVAVTKYRTEYRDANPEYMGEWRKANRERVLEYTRESREYRNEKIACSHCGRMVSRRNIAGHTKTQRCINNPLENHL